MNKKVFALVDCNNFYVSCERVFRPDLMYKPVAVLSNNDGCLVARSQEVKKLGIKMGAPYFEHQKQLEELKANIFSSNYQLYGDMSSRVMEVLSDITDEIEIYSIDEAFLTFNNFNNKDLYEVGELIEKRVRMATGLPVSIGIGSTKTLAKAASEIAKKRFGDPKDSYKFGKVFIINSDEGVISEELKSIGHGDVWGIGRRYSYMLETTFGVKTAYDFATLSPASVKAKMGVVGLRTQSELQGKSCLALDMVNSDKKSIVSSRSFGFSVTLKKELEEAVSSYVSTAAQKLRKQNNVCSQISVFLVAKLGNGKYRYLTKTIELDEPSSFTSDIVNKALMIVNQIFVDGYRYKKAGVMLSRFVPETEVSYNLFSESKLSPEKKLKVSKIIDKLNKKLENPIKIAAVGLKQKWKMKNNLRSKHFTTSFDELLEVG
jgi:DNA polymerase V